MKIKNGLLTAVALFILSTNLMALDSRPAEKDIYQIKIYRMKTNGQVTQVDNFLKNAYLPALHRLGVSRVGVFKNVGIDTAVEKSIYVWMRTAETFGPEVFLPSLYQLIATRLKPAAGK